MRTIIAGGRKCTDPKVLHAALEKCGWAPTVVLCGMAKGADFLGHLWATRQNIPIEEYPAQWNGVRGFDIGAGIKRNKLMAEKADALIALWDGRSSGTGNMITTARKLGLKVYVELY